MARSLFSKVSASSPSIVFSLVSPPPASLPFIRQCPQLTKPIDDNKLRRMTRKRWVLHWLGLAWLVCIRLIKVVFAHQVQEKAHVQGLAGRR